MDGILSLHKPAGLTSHDVVARVRRVCRTKRAGHAGTLDPDATGVLVVAVGQATRLLPHLDLEPKQYTARMVLGISTTTEDASGTTEQEADASHVTNAELAAVLPQFTGNIFQVPPMVSALHHEGRRLYDLAREGITVERIPRPVIIQEIRLTDFAAGPRAEATLHVVCGGGTYIRTLCKDIGAVLELPAHMKTLVRNGVGPFQLSDALPLDDLTPETTQKALVPMEKALPFPVYTLTDIDADNVRMGRAIGQVTLPYVLEYPITLLHKNHLIALARIDDNGWLHPFKVFAAAEENPAS